LGQVRCIKDKKGANMCIDDMNIESSARSSVICLAVTSVCYKSSVVKNKIEIYNLKLYISAN
jgi:hypothetical protein